MDTSRNEALWHSWCAVSRRRSAIAFSRTYSNLTRRFNVWFLLHRRLLRCSLKSDTISTGFCEDRAELSLPLNFKKFSRSSGLLAWFSRSTVKRLTSSFTRSIGDRNAQNELCQRTGTYASIQKNIGRFTKDYSGKERILTTAHQSFLLMAMAFALVSNPVYAKPKANKSTATPMSGKASWYTGYKRTASGLFDPKSMTAAHKTLPFGTIVRAVASNGNSVDVKIDNRGPFIRGRILDFTPAAFEKLAPLDQGVVKVQMEILSKP